MTSQETGLPERFDPETGENIKWKAKLGSQTYSTPVISGGKVFIGTNNDDPRDCRHQGDCGVLYCLDEKDGSLCWQLVVPKLTYSPYWDWPREGIVSPATVEAEKVYIVSNRGEVMCLDINGQKDGNDGPYKDEGRHMAPEGAAAQEVTSIDADIIWLYDIPGELGVRQHDGAHSSILLVDDYLYVNTSNGVDDTHRWIRSPDAPSLIVLDKRTGRFVASDDEGIGPRIFHSTWSSPALGEVDGEIQIYFGGGDGLLYAFGPFSAKDRNNVAHLKKIWQYDGDPTAPKLDVHIYVKNREQSPSNIKSMPVFHEKKVYLTLGGDIWWGKDKSWLQCIDATKSGDITQTGQIWSYDLQGHCCATPSVYNDMVFVGDTGRLVHCVDAHTGKGYWTHRLKGDVWASTLAADSKVYAGSRRGDFWVFAASKEKKILHNTMFDSEICASPVAANGVLYIATMKYLYAINDEKME